MQKKAVAIVIVWGILIVLSLLAMSALRLMSNQGTMTESSVRRTKAYYTAKAAMVVALEERRNPALPLSANVSENGMTAVIQSRGASADFPNCEEINIKVDY